MLIRKLSRSICSKMSATQFLCPAAAAGESKMNPHSPKFEALLSCRCFHSWQSGLITPKLAIAQSAAQRPVTVYIDATPRLTKAEAQTALFDYLHITRGLAFQDAEHISKNSPRFLAGLIAKVDKERDVSKALPRFFRYHPINEFEPFFESLGLSPAEFATLLPRGLIFLNDDQILLDNYRTLCDYGVPRTKIGRMCKEATEIFRYGAGVLDAKLRIYEQFGLSKSAVSKLVTSNPQLLVGEADKGFIQALQRLKEVGFDGNWIGGYLSMKSTWNWKRILDTLSFLHEVGYTDAQIRDLLKKDVGVLFDGSGKQVYAIVGALLKLGLTMNDVFALVLENHQILSHKCRENFWRALHFLVEIGMEPEYIGRILSSHLRFLDSHSFKGPKTVLRIFKGDKHGLCSAIKKDESMFLKFAFKAKSCSGESRAARNPINVLEKTEFLQRMGYLDSSDEMVKAMNMFRGRGDQLQERFDCLVQAGLDYTTVVNIVKRAPTILNQTKDILKEKIECLKYFGYPVESIAAFPTYLCCDIGRIRARFSMYAWVREMGAAKPMLSVSTVVAGSDARFIKYFVNIHPEGAAMWESIKSRYP